MSPSQYRTALEDLGLTQADAAMFLGISARTSNGYANGSPIPKATKMLLNVMVWRELTPEQVSPKYKYSPKRMRR